MVACLFLHFLLFDQQNLKSTYLLFTLQKLKINNVKITPVRASYTYISILNAALYSVLFLCQFLLFCECTHQMITALADDTDIVVYVQRTK